MRHAYITFVVNCYGQTPLGRCMRDLNDRNFIFIHLFNNSYCFLTGIVGGGVHLGAAATNRPVPGDYDDGEIGGMIGRGNRSTLGRRLATYATYDQPHLRLQKKKKKKKNKLIINQDVLLRTPITQVRRHIDNLKCKSF
jgi:hypothetical protein